MGKRRSHQLSESRIADGKPPSATLSSAPRHPGDFSPASFSGLLLAGIGGRSSGGGSSLGPFLFFLLLLLLLHRQLVDPHLGQTERAIPLLPTVGGFQTLDSLGTVQHAPGVSVRGRIFRLLSIVMVTVLLTISAATSQAICLPPRGKHLSIKRFGDSHKWDGANGRPFSGGIRTSTSCRRRLQSPIWRAWPTIGDWSRLLQSEPSRCSQLQ